MASNDQDNERYESDFESDESFTEMTSSNQQVEPSQASDERLPLSSGSEDIEILLTAPASSTDESDIVTSAFPFCKALENAQGNSAFTESSAKNVFEDTTLDVKTVEEHGHTEQIDTLQTDPGLLGPPALPFAGAHIPTPPTSPRCRPVRNLSPGRYKKPGSRSPSSSPHRHGNADSSSGPAPRSLVQVSQRSSGGTGLSLDAYCVPEQISDLARRTLTLSSSPEDGGDMPSMYTLNEMAPAPHIHAFTTSPFMPNAGSIKNNPSSGQLKKQITSQKTNLRDTEETLDINVNLMPKNYSQDLVSNDSSLSALTICPRVITDDETDSDDEWEVNFESDEPISATHSIVFGPVSFLEPLMPQRNEDDSSDNASSAAETGEADIVQAIPNILLPNQIADGNCADHFGKVVVAHTLDISQSPLFSSPEADQMNISSIRDDELEVSSDYDSSDGEVTFGHSAYIPSLLLGLSNEPSLNHATDSDDVDEESRPVTPPPWNRPMEEQIMNSTEGSDSGDANDNVYDMANGESELISENLSDHSNTVDRSRIISSSPVPVLSPVVVLSNASVASQILADISPNDERLTFEQLMNMDASTLGDMEDDSSSASDFSEGINRWPWEADNPLLAPMEEHSDEHALEGLRELQTVDDEQLIVNESTNENPFDTGISSLVSLFDQEGDTSSHPSNNATQSSYVNGQHHEILASQQVTTRPAWMTEEEWCAVLRIIREDLAEAGSTSHDEILSSPPNPTPEETERVPLSFTNITDTQDVDTRLLQTVGGVSEAREGLRTESPVSDEEQPPSYSSLFAALNETQAAPPEYDTLPKLEQTDTPVGTTDIVIPLQCDSTSAFLALASDGQDIYTISLQDNMPYVGKIIIQGRSISTECGTKEIRVKKKFKIPLEIYDTRMMCIDSKRNLLVVTMNYAILRLKLSGKVKDVIVSSGDNLHHLKSLVGVDYCQSADLYIVTDVLQHCVMLVNPITKSVVSRFGEFGSALTQLNNPSSVKCSVSHGVLSLVVCDPANTCLKIFNTEGQNLKTYGLNCGEDCPLKVPCDVCVDGNADMYVADSELRQVFRYRNSGDGECWKLIVASDKLGGMTPRQIAVIRESGRSILVVMVSLSDDDLHNNLHMFPFVIVETAFF